MKLNNKYFFSEWDIIYLLKMTPSKLSDCDGAANFRTCMSCIVDGLGILEVGNVRPVDFAKDTLFTVAMLLPNFDKESFKIFIESFLSISIKEDFALFSRFWQEFLDAPVGHAEFMQSAFWINFCRRETCSCFSFPKEYKVPLGIIMELNMTNRSKTIWTISTATHLL